MKNTLLTWSARAAMLLAVVAFASPALAQAPADPPIAEPDGANAYKTGWPVYVILDIEEGLNPVKLPPGVRPKDPDKNALSGGDPTATAGVANSAAVQAASVAGGASMLSMSAGSTPSGAMPATAVRRELRQELQSLRDQLDL
jgi:hypothetical protein